MIKIKKIDQSGKKLLNIAGILDDDSPLLKIEFKGKMVKVKYREAGAGHSSRKAELELYAGAIDDEFGIIRGIESIFFYYDAVNDEFWEELIKQLCSNLGSRVVVKNEMSATSM